MKVENGKFYFIKDEFFNVFKGYKLMENKENGNKRPCYFCFNDPENEKIIWFVPISSKVDKYKTIYHSFLWYFGNEKYIVGEISQYTLTE